MDLELHGWRFHNFPRPLPWESYERSQAEFVRYYRRMKGVHAIYRIGSVTNPGLSDLDFVVVLDDKFAHRFGTEYDLSPFSPETRYVLYHGQIFIPRGLFPDLPLLWPIFEIEHIHGDDSCRPHVREEELRQASAISLCTNLVWDFCRNLFRYQETKDVNVRMAQAKLNLVPKNLRLLEDLLGKNLPAAAKFGGQVTGLRRDWFCYRRTDLSQVLVHLLSEATPIISEMARVLSDFLLASSPFCRMLGTESRFSIHRRRTSIDFSPGTQAVSSSFFEDRRVLSLTVPFGLILPLTLLSSGSGPLTEYIKTTFQGSPPFCQLGQSAVMQRIVSAANDHCIFLQAKQIYAGHLRYFSYRPPFSRPAVERAYRKALSLLRNARWRSNVRPF